ncbi:hypothetical protein [Halocatena halophila]|uniref:hypothetical protein n=1 Tax=Halocatena halophila TaxID=2814576 RepID=UPI002ED3F3E1
MSEITDLSVSYSEKKQVNDFEPVEVSTEATVSLESGDDQDEVFDETLDKLEDMVARGLAQRLMREKRDKDD